MKPLIPCAALVVGSLAASLAWAAPGGAVTPSAGVMGSAPAARAAAPATTQSVAVPGNGIPSTTVFGTAGTTLPPPPPSSLTQLPLRTGVPATVSDGAPATTTSSLQSSTGLGPTVDAELRPAGAANAAQVANVQAALAAGGLYSGPIDGILSAGTRAAIARYQDVQRIPSTGQLDGETVARLDRTGSSGSGGNGATATAGAQTTASGFGSTLNSLGIPVIAPVPTPAPIITSVPFALSPGGPSLSPLPPPGTTIQP